MCVICVCDAMRVLYVVPSHPPSTLTLTPTLHSHPSAHPFTLYPLYKCTSKYTPWGCEVCKCECECECQCGGVSAIASVSVSFSVEDECECRYQCQCQCQCEGECECGVVSVSVDEGVPVCPDAHANGRWD